MQKNIRFGCLILLFIFFGHSTSYSQDQKLDSLKAVLTANVHDTVKLEAMHFIFFNLLQGNKTDDSIALYYTTQMEYLAGKNLQKSNSPSLKNTYLSYLAEAYCNRASYLGQDSIITALNLYDKAIDIFKNIGRYSEMAYTLANKGVCYKDIDYVKAINFNFEALKLFEKQKDMPGAVFAMSSIADLYNKKESSPKAIEYYKKVLAYYDTLTNSDVSDITQAAAASNNLGGTYLEEGKYEEAAKFLEKALSLTRSIDDFANASYILEKIGRLKLRQKKYDEALSKYNEALQLAETNRSKANAYNGIGELYLEKKNYNSAITALNKAISFGKNSGSLDVQDVASELLYQAYKKNGQYDKSLQIYEFHTLIKDSTKAEEAKKLLGEQEIKYEYEKKELLNKVAQEKDMAEIKTENERRQTRKNILLYSFIAVTIFLILGILFLLNYFKQKSIITANKNNELKQKLLLTQMNPHFIFNSVDNIQSLIYNKQDKEAISYLTKFSKLTRQILENSRENYISLSEELSMLDNYLTIQKLLYNNNFTYNIAADATIDADDVLLPPMLTQPFIENAVKHGLKNKTEGGIVTVHFYMKDNGLFFEVTDNGTGLISKEDVQTKKSLSTQITKERLNSISGKKNILIHTINIADENNKVQGVKTSFEIPYVCNN